MKYIILFIIIVLMGCQTNHKSPDEYDHCFMGYTELWENAEVPKALERRLLGLHYKGMTIEEQMVIFSKYPVKDAWFKNSDGEYRLCRYEDTNNSCTSQEVSAQFWLKDDEYIAVKLVEKVCLKNNIRS